MKNQYLLLYRHIFLKGNMGEGGVISLELPSHVHMVVLLSHKNLYISES